MPKADAGKSLTRIWQLLELLPSPGAPLTKAELHDRGCELHGWGVDEKTTQRDLEFLASVKLAQRVNTPASAIDDTRRGGRSGYRWAAVAGKNPNTLRLLHTEDALAFHLIEGMVERLLPPEVANALSPQRERARRKLERERYVNQHARWAEKVRIVPEGFALQAPKLMYPEVLKLLQTALLRERVIRVRYRALHKTVAREHLLEPRGLWQSGTLLYVVVTHPDKPMQKPSSYRVDRFESVILTDQPNSSRHFSLQEFLDQGGAQFALDKPVLHFSAWAHPEVCHRLEETPINATMVLADEDPSGATARPPKTQDKGEWKHVSASVVWSEHFENWILQQGERLRVLGSPELRAHIAARLTEALRHYTP